METEGNGNLQKFSRTAVISDIHGNSPALKAVLADIHREKCDNIIVLGDILEGFDPKGCIDILKQENNLIGIRGNTENYFFTRDLDKFPLQNLDLYQYQIKHINWTRNQLSPEDMMFISYFKIALQRKEQYYIHDTPFHHRQIIEHARDNCIEQKYQEFMFHSRGIRKDADESEDAHVAEFMKNCDIKYLYVGHTHEAFIKNISNRFILNPGSTGMPLDGSHKSSWMLVEDEVNHTIKRVDYDVENALDLLKRTTCPLGTSQDNYGWVLENGRHYRYR